jgi:hypothetical protein
MGKRKRKGESARNLCDMYVAGLREETGSISLEIAPSFRTWIKSNGENKWN